MRKSTLLQITSIREEDNMKTMKKAISVLLLVCMVFALCSAGAYATEAGSTTGTGGENNTAGFTISLDKDVFSTSDQVSAKAIFPNGTSAKDYTITWSWGNNTYTAQKGAADVAWKADQIKNGQEISATATKATDSSTGSSNEETLNSNTVTAKVIPPVSSVEISCNNNNTLSCTAKAADGTDVSSNIKTYSWSSDNDKVTLATPEGATTTYSSTDTSTAQTATITVKVTDNFGTEVTSAQYSVTIPAAEVPVTSITVTPATTSVAPGGTVQMSAAVTPDNATNKAVKWSVSDGATVDSNGLVTVKADADVGSTITVTATAQDESNVAGTAQITVSSVLVESVSLNKSTTTIAAGSNETLTATVTPDNATDKTVKWTSSDTTVATVDSNGKVTAVKEGSATITATAGGKSATCTVTVTKPATVRIDVSSNLANNTITARGSSMTLYAKVYKDNSLFTNSAVTWSVTSSTSSNGLINLTNCNYINNAWTAVVTGNFNGDYTITAACTIDGVVYSEDLKVKVAYAPSIVAGNYSVWNGRDALSFLVNDHINNWNGNVWIDGIMVNPSYYTCIGSSDGEIWLTLSPSLLNMVNQNNPKNSTHTITVGDSRAAAATGYFRTWGTASSFNGVKTGDDANLGLWAALLAVSAVGAGAAVVICKRRKANRG